MRCLLVALIAIVLSSCQKVNDNGYVTSPPQTTGKGAIAILRTQAGGELERTLIALCESRNPADWELAITLLQDSSTLQRLDTEEEYRYPFQKLRVTKVVFALTKLPTEKAQRALLTLAGSQVFMAQPLRETLLMHACGAIHQPSPELLRFLDSHAEPDSDGSNIIVGILVRMRSPGAYKLIEQRLLSPDETLSNKRAWLITSLLPFRNDPEVVAIYSRLLQSKTTEASVLSKAVQSLFDYQPLQWYGADPVVPRPPPRMEASTEVLEKLLALADFAGKLDIQEDTKQSVAKARKEIEEILEFRRSGAPERIDRLIADLDSGRFPARDRANHELAQYGKWAEPALRRALEAQPSQEARTRLESLLAKLHPPKTKRPQ